MPPGSGPGSKGCGRDGHWGQGITQTYPNRGLPREPSLWRGDLEQSPYGTLESPLRPWKLRPHAWLYMLGRVPTVAPMIHTHSLHTFIFRGVGEAGAETK